MYWDEEIWDFNLFCFLHAKKLREVTLTINCYAYYRRHQVATILTAYTVTFVTFLLCSPSLVFSRNWFIPFVWNTCIIIRALAAHHYAAAPLSLFIYIYIIYIYIYIYIYISHLSCIYHRFTTAAFKYAVIKANLLILPVKVKQLQTNRIPSDISSSKRMS